MGLTLTHAALRPRRAERRESTSFTKHWLVAYAIAYTLAMSKTVPVREFRSNLADLLDEVADRREHVTVTRHGRPAAVLVPIDEYQALEETAEILSDDDTLAAIRNGLDDLAEDAVVTLEQARADHASRAQSG